MIKIFRIEIKEFKRKFLWFNLYNKNFIELYYDYLEDRLYYKDKKKEIATGKDFCRSIQMIYKMIKRMNAFEINFFVKENYIDDFFFNLSKSGEYNDIKRLMFGTQNFSMDKLESYFTAIGLDDESNIDPIKQYSYLN